MVSGPVVLWAMPWPRTLEHAALLAARRARVCVSLCVSFRVHRDLISLSSALSYLLIIYEPCGRILCLLGWIERWGSPREGRDRRKREEQREERGPSCYAVGDELQPCRVSAYARTQNPHLRVHPARSHTLQTDVDSHKKGRALYSLTPLH